MQKLTAVIITYNEARNIRRCIESLRGVVDEIVVVDSFSGFTNDSLNIYDFWFNGVYCAVTARLLAYHCKDLDTERPFIAGLLHKIGHLVTHQVMPDEAKQVVELAEQKDMAIYQAEREIMGFDYGEVGAALMAQWQLPGSLQEMTAFHIEPEKALDHKLETAIIHIASQITENALAKIPVNAETLVVNPLVWDITELSIDNMERLKAEVDLQASSVMSLLFTHKKSA